MIVRHTIRLDVALLQAAHFGDSKFLELRDAEVLLAEGGHVALFVWSNGAVKFSVRALERVANVDCAKWLIEEQHLRPNEQSLVSACALGSLTLVEYFCSKGANVSSRAFTEAARHGVAMLKELWQSLLVGPQNRSFVSQSTACESACHVGDVMALEWLISRRFPVTINACCLAARGGHLNCLDYISNQTNVNLRDAAVLAAAAEGGFIDSLEVLREKGATFGIMVAINAAERGFVKMLKYYDEVVPASPTKWSPLVCAHAAKNNHLECLNFLRSVGCPWNAQTASEAAQNGHFGLLRWLQSEGCPVDRHAVVIAIADGTYDTVRWVLEKKFVLPSKAGSVAAQRGDVYILQLLLEAGFKFGQDACLAASTAGKLEALDWLRKNGCSWNKEACFAASSLFPNVRKFIAEDDRDIEMKTEDR